MDPIVMNDKVVKISQREDEFPAQEKQISSCIPENDRPAFVVFSELLSETTPNVCQAVFIP